jgi:hypothetical protein
MKISIFLLSIVLFTLTLSCETKSTVSRTTSLDAIQASNKNEEPITFLESLSYIDLLTKFFNPYKISNDTAIWKQDLESIDMRVSADGYLHTVIDSIFTINDRLLILFTTYDISEDGEVNSCHPCGVDYSIALLEKTDTGYTILRFKKHLISTGCFGYGAGGEIVKFGKNLTTIKIGGGWVGTGAAMSHNDYFNIEDFLNLLHIETHNSNEGMCDETDFKCIDKTERELIPFDKHPLNKPAIIIKYKHTYFDKKIIIIEKSDTLMYDGYHFNKDIYYEGV